ncbi:hypothetical protein BLA28_15445 [Eisenbergiella tayi]|nr:hypothetical protein BLA28_15445 [Eisenbergiella tayi]
MEAGGTQALLMNIYRNIDRNKLQFDFLVEYPEKQFYDDEICSLGGEIYYTSVREDFNIIKFQNQLTNILLENKNYKIVHMHTYSIGYFCLRIAEKCGVPVRIAHSHSNSMTQDYKKYIKYILQRLYTIHATDLFACSQDAGRYLFKHKKFHVLTNAIDSSKFVANTLMRETIRKELNISNKFVIGHVGRFQPEKNHDFLLEIFMEIRRKRNDAVLLLVGSGNLKSQIITKVNLMSLTNNVLFLDNRRDMNRIYQAMDVFLFPSLYEGLGIVAVEAQASGIPVVGSERIPKEVEISPLYKHLSLDNSAEMWASESIEFAHNVYSHSNMQRYIINAGFDINTVVSEIENYYIESAEIAKMK